MRVVLHGLSDDVGHLGEFAVVHFEHGVQNPSLHRFESIYDMRYGTGEDYV